ncbi:MAG TPA: acyl-CoA dehydrogenase family protein [Gemmataceae bacterium]|jgi:alkylation response protein AidB-like acyl-CoA dehydrogenase|nr:acyl-CoA dehydrogenase family protein [Gemmataceae bacterium]
MLRRERETLAALLPNLDDDLARMSLLEMERAGNPAIPAFRERGGPGLLIPAECGGRGATPLQAVQVQRAIGSRAPSLAVATTMHHFSVATAVEMATTGPGLEWMLLEGIARQNLYVASGFAEGKTGASILSSCVHVQRTPAGLVLNGSKKPCSLSASMDLLTASALVPAGSGHPSRFAVVTIPADTPGIERRPFWSTWVLAGAESDELVLHDVVVPDPFVSYLAGPGSLDSIQDKSFLWFELLITAAYLGIASALVERTVEAGKGSAADRVQLAAEVEAAMAALEGVASAMEAGERNNDDLARMLLVRYAVQEAIARAAAHAAELLGGLAFVASPEVAYLLAAARALAFHPPSRFHAAGALDRHLAGGPLGME